jgi:hypothetical protein
MLPFFCTFVSIMIGKTAIDVLLSENVLLIDKVAWFQANNKEVKEMVVKLIQEGQLIAEGVDSTGNVIGYYSAFTEILSGGRKREGDPYTLEDTGEFFRSMFVQVLADSIKINADYAKMNDKDWWDLNILKLTEENLTKYVEKIKENYIIFARRVLEIN